MFGQFLPAATPRLAHFIRVRIRSWKDVLAILLIGAVLLALQYFLQRFFPDWSERKVRGISTVIVLALALLVVFVIL